MNITQKFDKKINDLLEIWDLYIKIEDLSKRRIEQKLGILNEQYLPEVCATYINKMSQKQEANLLKGLKE